MRKLRLIGVWGKWPELTKFRLIAEQNRNMDLEGLVAQARQRRPQPMPAKERLYAGASAAAFLASVGALGAVLPTHLDRNPAVLLLLVGLYALASRCQFEVG